ncbi:MAG: ABC transporter permease [Porcipelethomonas sp.]
MGKFVNLVKNEYIKIFSKVSTWIMAAIILALSIGCPSMALIGEYTMGFFDSQTKSECVEYYESQIDYLNEVKTENWEQEAEMLQFKLDNEIYEGDWRDSAAMSYFDLKYSGEQSSALPAMETALKNDDWKSFYESSLSVPDFMIKAERKIYEYCVENNVAPDPDNWRYNAVTTLEYSKEQIDEMDSMRSQGMEIDSAEYESLSDTVLLYQYRLDNNVEYDISENNSWGMSGKFDFWNVFCTAPGVLSFISVVIIIICGGIVSNEFSAGTIKFLLINPVKRWKILASKYFTSISFGYILIFAAYIVSMLTTMIMFGADNLSASCLSISDGAVRAVPGFLYVLIKFILGSVEMIVMATLAFAISSLARSSALAIGTSVMAYFGGSTIVMILKQLNFDWGRYLIFANLSLSDAITGDTFYSGQTAAFSLTVIAVHMVIFLLTAWDGFTRREV